MWLQKSRCLASFLCLTMFFVSIAEAKDLYVNNVGGSDSQNGLSPNGNDSKSGPVRTISRAIQLAAKGDTIHVAKTVEPYRESISLQGGSNSGLVGRNFKIIGEGVVLDGRTEVPKDDWELISDNTYSTPAPSPYTILYLGNKPAERVVLEADASDVPALA